MTRLIVNLQDDASALSLPALRRWNRILRVFTAEYLGLALAAPTKFTRDGSSENIRCTDELVRKAAFLAGF